MNDNPISQLNQFSISYRDDIVTESNYPEHHHATHEIVLFLNADIRMFVGDRQYDIHDGDLLIVSKNTIHKLLYTVDSRYCRYVMNIGEWLINNILNSLGIKKSFTDIEPLRSTLLHTNMKEQNELRLLFEVVFSAFKQFKSNNNLHSHAEFQVNLAHLLIILDKTIKFCAKKEINIKSKDHVQGIIQYIDTHYNDNITLEQLANVFFLNKYHISHIFKQRTGLSVIEYIQMRRVAEVQKLLRKKHLTTTHICYMCGFNNIQHFYRVFKKIGGCTPEQYRKQNVDKKGDAFS